MTTRLLIGKGLALCLRAHARANMFGFPMMSLALLDIYEWSFWQSTNA